MIHVRRSAERGFADHGWLKTFHTFSFAGYQDPRHMGFRSLRVINDDRVTPGAGFPDHPHRDMEILSYVIEGALEHRDSMGHGSVIRPGDVQRISAGTGITHSEFNPSDVEGARFLQIWILPERTGGTPSYDQRHFPDEERRGRLRLVASKDGREESISLRQDVDVHAGLLGRDDRVAHELADGRHAWVQVVNGRIRLGELTLAEGDGAASSGESRLELESDGGGEILLFDLA